MSDRRLRVVFADDEPVARTGLERLIRGDARLELVGDAVDGADALTTIRARRPDIAILDIGMPGLSGLEVVRQLAPDERPIVIFATAYDEFAIEAFDLHSADYLLKPYEDERFRMAVDRAHERVVSRALPPQALDAVLETFARRRLAQDHLLVKQGDNVIFLRVADIDWCESADNYVRIHAGARRHLVRDTMQSLERRLVPHGFARIHRNAIVNRARIAELRPTSNGEYVVHLTTGERLTLSRGRRSVLLRDDR